jgi:hypothetical protein
MGDADLVCDTNEQLSWSVSKIKEAYSEYEKLKHLQLEYIENHEILSPGVVCVTYSNGESILVNYNSTSAKVRGITVPAQDYRIVGVK